MQDLGVNELADEVRSDLLAMGVNISKTDCRRLTREFFKYAENIAEKGESRLSMYGRDIACIYPVFDVKTLCNELAIGEVKGLVTVDRLLYLKKLAKNVIRYLKRVPMFREIE